MAENARLFMKLTKKASSEVIVGEAAAREFSGQIELEDWSWGASHSAAGAGARATAGSAPGRSLAGTITPSPFRFSKVADRSTPSMLSALVNDDLLVAEIVLEEAADVEFKLVVELDKVRVVGYALQADVEDKSGLAKEDWTFSYEQIEFRYTQAGQQGTTSVVVEREPEAAAKAARPWRGASAPARAFQAFVDTTLAPGPDWKSPAARPLDWKDTDQRPLDWKSAATSRRA